MPLQDGKCKVLPVWMYNEHMLKYTVLVQCYYYNDIGIDQVGDLGDFQMSTLVKAIVLFPFRTFFLLVKAGSILSSVCVEHCSLCT